MTSDRLEQIVNDATFSGLYLSMSDMLSALAMFASLVDLSKNDAVKKVCMANFNAIEKKVMARINADGLYQYPTQGKPS